ncbi:MAG TPA: hypothetical protein VHA13_00080, partial [Gammaproteobacteria bacterium]|nr:hypothetical protein [Gammaproteobacteria bacterium]
QLNSCKTYADAKVPAGLWPYWNDQMVSDIKNQLQELKAYGIKIQKNSNGLIKGKLAENLADKLLADIEQPGAKFNEHFQRKFLLNLHQYDNEFKDHRSYKRIIGNLALCVMSAVIGYVIAAAINKSVNGHYSFFSETATQQRIKRINKALMPSKILHNDPVRILALGVNHNLGKKSNLYKFFGHEKGKPVHPIGDEKVLLKIKQFIY